MCTLVYTEYIVKSISVRQIYTKSRVHHPISVYTENILSTLLKSLIQCCSVHCSRQRDCQVYICSPNLHRIQSTSFQITVHCFVVYIGLYRVHCPVYFCSPNLYVFQSKPLSLYAENILSTPIFAYRPIFDVVRT